MEQDVKQDDQNKVEVKTEEVVSSPAVATTTMPAKAEDDDITLIGDVPAIKEESKKAPIITTPAVISKVPIITAPISAKPVPVGELGKEPPKEEPSEEKKEEAKDSKEAKKDSSLLWKILTIVFLLSTGLLAFLHFSEKEYVTVVIVGKDDNVQLEKIEKGGTIAEPKTSKEGFLGWYSNNAIFDFSTVIDKDYVIIAKYDERATYTVSFNTDGGSNLAPVQVKEKELIKVPTNPTKTGFLFKEWILDDTPYDFNTPVTKDITLKATWKVNDGTITVTFDTQGGSKVGSQKVKIGSKIKKPGTPTKTGFKFGEWQLEGAAFDFNSIVDSDVTLVATWTEKKQLTINFDSDGGSVVPTKNVYEDDPVGALPTPTKADFVFSRWVLDGKTFDAKSKINKDVTVKAEWKTIDEANYDKAVAAIKGSYDVTKNGETINVNSPGCTITHDEIKVTDSKITFHITCGSKKGDKTAKTNIKVKTYTYTIVSSNGELPYNTVRINGVTTGCLYYADGSAQIDPEVGIKDGLISINKVDMTSDNITFLYTVESCKDVPGTTYVVKKG